MRLTSLDVHNYSICPNRYFNVDSDEIKNHPARETMKRIVLSKALGRDNKWNIQGLATVWDNMFWNNKESSQENVDSSVKGSISLRKLFNRLPEVYDAVSSKNLVTACEAGLYLYSSSDFITISDRGVEIWIFYNSSPKEMRRSLLVPTELYILRSALRKDFLGEDYITFDPISRMETFVVFYHVGPGSMAPKWFKVKCSRNDKAVLSIARQIKNKVVFQNPGEQCERCKVNC